MNRIHTANKGRIVATLALGLTLLLLSWYAAEARPSKLANVIEGKDEADETPTYTFSAPSDVQQQGWSMWRGDPQRTGFTESELNVDNLDIKWLITNDELRQYLDDEFGEGGTWIVSAPPVISNGRVFVGIEEVLPVNIFIPTLFSFDIETGIVLWIKRLDEPGDINRNIFASPLVHEGYVYQLMGTGLLAAVSVETGENKDPMKWPKQLAEQGQNHWGMGLAHDPSPAVDSQSDRLFICSDTMFYIIDLNTDEIIGEIDGIENFALNDTNSIVYGTYGTEKRWDVEPTEQGLIAYSIMDIIEQGADAIPLWELSLPMPTGSYPRLFSTPVYSNDQVFLPRVYVGPDYSSGPLYSVNAETGSINWQFTLPGEPQATGAVKDNFLYQASGEYIFKIDISPDINNPEDRVVWMFDSPAEEYSRILASPVIANGILYAVVPFDQDEYPWDWPNLLLVGMNTSDSAIQYVFDAVEITGHYNSGWPSPSIAGRYMIYTDDFGIVCLEDRISPATPSDLEATAVSYSQVELTWQDNSDNENGFEIERAELTITPNSSDNLDFQEIATVGSDVTSFSDRELQPNTTYYYRVRAFNSAGGSEYSNVANARTR